MKGLWTLTRHEFTARLRSFWLYILVLTVCFMAILSGNVFQQYFGTQTVSVFSGLLGKLGSLNALNASVLLFLGLVLGIRLSGSLAWEREHRTLEVLMTGPVRYSAVVVAKFLAELLALLLILSVYGLFLSLGQPPGRGVLSGVEIGILAVWATHVLPALALGLLVSAVFSTVRGAVIAVLVLFTVLASLEALPFWLETMRADELSPAHLYLRSALDTAAPVKRAISALAHLLEPARIHLGRSVWTQSGPTAALALCLATLAVACVVGKRRVA